MDAGQHHVELKCGFETLQELQMLSLDNALTDGGSTATLYLGERVDGLDPT